MTPGTHGIVHPWIPPTTGIPAGVLDELDVHLFRKLVSVLHRLETAFPESTHSSPAGSDTEGEDDLPPRAQLAINSVAESRLKWMQ
jgi:hypothetical protein